MKDLIAKIPLFVRKFIVDFVETSLAALLVLTPAGDDESLLHAAMVAVGVAALAAARRALPGFLVWLGGELQVPPAE